MAKAGGGGSPVIDEAVVRLVADVRTFLTQVESAKGKAVGGLKQVDDEAEKAEQGVEKIGGAFQKVAGAAMALGAAFSAMQLGKGAIEYEATMSRVVGLTAITEEAAKKAGSALLGMAKDIGKGPNELAEAYYFANSALGDAEKALAATEVAAKASAAGLGETKVVVDGVTSAMNAYRMEADKATEVTDTFVATVKYGKMAPADLAGALGRVLPIAAQLNVSLTELGANVATMTRTGLSVDEAITGIRAVMASLLKPTEGAKRAFADMGMSAADLRAQLGTEGLLSVLNTILTATKGNDELLTEIIPNIRALTDVLGSAGIQGDVYAQILKGMQEDIGLTDYAFQHHTKTVEYAGQRLKATFEATAYRLISMVLPSLAASVNDVTKAFRLGDPVFSAAGTALKAVSAVIAPFRSLLMALTAAWALHRLAIVANTLAMKNLAVQSAIGLGAMGASRAVLTGLAASLMSWQGALVLTGVALVGMDAILQRVMGSGLLSWLTGAASRQREYNRALEEYGGLLEEIQYLIDVGMREEGEARALKIGEYGAAMREAAVIVAQEQKKLAAVWGESWKESTTEALQEAELLIKVKMDELSKLVPKPTRWELLEITAGDPILTGKYAEEFEKYAEALKSLQVKREVEQIKALADAMRDAAKGTTLARDAAATTKASFTALGSAIGLVTDMFKAPDPMLPMLKMEQEQLEALKDKFGEAFSPEQEARLNAITGAIDEQESRVKVVTEAVGVYGYTLARVLGPEQAAGAVTNLANRLSELEAPVLAKVMMMLPEMEMARMVTFLSLLGAGVTVPVALVIETNISEAMQFLTKLPIANMPSAVTAALEKAFGLTGAGLSLKNIVEQVAIAQEAERKGAAAIGRQPAALDKTTASASATEKALLELIKAWHESGLSAEAFRFALDVAGKAMAAFNLTAEQLVAVFRESGLVVQEFTRRMWALEMLEVVKARANAAAQAVNDLYDAFNRLFAQPTREEAALNLRLARLREQREQALQGGKGNVKGYVTELDKQIAAIEDELELRRLHNDVLKAELDVADRARITDQNQQQMARNLIDAMGDASQKAADMAWNLWVSTVALQAWTTDLGRWMAAVGAAPAYQSGGIVPGSAGQATLAWLHGGEVVLNAAQAGALSRGDINVPITINADSQDFDAIKQAAHAAVEEALTYARARWYRSGSSLSSTIG